MDIDKLFLRRYALSNAIKYHGKADAGSVVGKILIERPELKKDAKELKKEIEDIKKSAGNGNRKNGA